MQTIRLGDGPNNGKAEAVATWQRRMKIHDDGKFGPATQAVTRRFQKLHGLVDDGIVGAKTWAASDSDRGEAITQPTLYARVSPSQIGWGKYQTWEGPWFKGRRPFELPEAPTFGDRLIEVVTATEGGALDAINMYDKCIVTVGAIQWCEASMLGVTRLLSAAATQDSNGVLAALAPITQITGAVFMKFGEEWRWMLGGKPMVAQPQTRQIFLGATSAGPIGSWTDAQKMHARTVAAALANVWMSDAACRGQVDFTRDQMLSFVWGAAKKTLFDPTLKPEDKDGMVGALQSAYVSFAASLPAVAAAQFDAFQKATTAAPWSKDWAVELLAKLTFGPQIAIYPSRYNKIRPVLDRVWGIDLPDFAAELKTEAAASRLVTAAEVQWILVEHGYDLGPADVDDKYGPKTTAAVAAFQADHGLKATGITDQNTLRALRAA